MKIGITGFTRSGKTDLAQNIARTREWRKQDPGGNVLDGYIEKLSEDTGLAFGHYATHIDNIRIALHRDNVERTLYRNKKNLIVCGTLIDTLAYAALYTVPHLDDRAERARTATTMESLGMICMDTWDYDILFVLPSENKDYDWNLGYALRIFKINHVDLSPFEDRTKIALERIDEFEAKKADEQRVRDSAGDPEEQGQESGSVSDVQESS